MKKHLKEFQEWVKTHRWNTDFKAVDCCIAQGELMILFVNDKEKEMPWSVQHAGNGHYFKTREEAEEYIKSQKYKRKGKMQA